MNNVNNNFLSIIKKLKIKKQKEIKKKLYKKVITK